MKMITNKNITIIICLFLFIAGCATIQIPEQSLSIESLKETASLYWKLKEENKYKEAFKLEDSERLKKLNLFEKKDFDSYISSIAAYKNLGITSYSLTNVRIIDSEGLVDIEFTFTLPQFNKPVKQILTDKWVFKNGRWLHILHD